MKKLFALCAAGLLLAPAAQARQVMASGVPSLTEKYISVPEMMASAAPLRTPPPAFRTGTTFLNIGLGLGARYGNGLPFGIAIDHMVNRNLSIGGQIDFWTWKRKSGPYTYRHTFIPIALRGAYHFDGTGNNLDLYLGIALGYWLNRYSDDAPNGYVYMNDYDSRVLWGIFGGLRYFFHRNVGFFGEAGYGVTYGKIGLTFKL